MNKGGHAERDGITAVDCSGTVLNLYVGSSCLSELHAYTNWISTPLSFTATGQPPSLTQGKPPSMVPGAQLPSMAPGQP